ncbi:MAG TPA: phosphohistidine phosphatase SixA [Polyangia bacterium]|nr:phosphohistidine phosphatase SixA [Polyangia bacterium]
MRVTLIRHGEAGDDAPRDEARSLTLRGRASVTRVGRALRRRGGDFTLIVSSPLVRAVQTAEIVAAAVGYGGRLVVSEALEPEARVSRTVAWLATLEGEDSVALCAHEPILSSLAGALLRLDRFPALRKAEALRLRLPDGPGHPGELRWRIDPETGARQTP